MSIRKGSIVDVVEADISGDGGTNSYLTGVTVVDITNAYLEFDNGSTDVILPWHSIRSVSVTTY